MVAAFFFYYNYKFSTYKFIDFNKIILYEKSDIFEPKSDEYYLLIFSSKMSDLDELIKKIPKDHPIIALDIFQQRKKYKGIIYTTAGINTIIKIIQYLNIYEVPVVVKIKRYNKKLYKQDSPLETLK
jgi:uncharacterized protein involved in tolerance to divalent cations